MKNNTIDQEHYRVPLCPYLAIGNQRVLIHLDAYCVPQSVQWPRPGAPDRLAWRDPADEWPYWDELPEAAICLRMPYFQYRDGSIEYLHQAVEVEIDYVNDTNVLVGRYSLPGGAVVEVTSFVASNADIWARRYRATGNGRFVHQGELFEKCVRGHPAAHLGHIDFRGILDAVPKGMYVIAGSQPMVQRMGKVEIDVQGHHCWDVYVCFGDDLAAAAKLGEHSTNRGLDSLLAETVSADRAWVAKAKEPVSTDCFVRANYKRWLLANRLCLGTDGAMACGPRPFWGYSFPRDSALIAGGFAAAGLVEEAQSIVEWHLSNMPDSCIHEARYWTDRTPMLLDNRHRQGDNPGFLAWAAAFVCKARWDDAFAGRIRHSLFALADLMVSYRDDETLLPMPESDYWEGQPAESLSIAVGSIGGLLGASYVAERLGETELAARYCARALEIKRGLRTHLWNSDECYYMQSIKPANTASDVAACWGVYPFGALDPRDATTRRAMERLKQDLWSKDHGGMVVGLGTPLESLWFYHSTVFLLGVMGIGDETTVEEILASIENNACPQGLIPEQIGRVNGHLWGCNYFTTSHACLLLYAFACPKENIT